MHVCLLVFCECCVLSGGGLWDDLITRPEESYRLWCVVVCDLETLWLRRSWPALGRSATAKKNSYVSRPSLCPGMEYIPHPCAMRFILIISSLVMSKLFTVVCDAVPCPNGLCDKSRQVTETNVLSKSWSGTGNLFWMWNYCSTRSSVALEAEIRQCHLVSCIVIPLCHPDRNSINNCLTFARVKSALRSSLTTSIVRMMREFETKPSWPILMNCLIFVSRKTWWG
jgi:hypothetical protein